MLGLLSLATARWTSRALPVKEKQTACSGLRMANLWIVAIASSSAWTGAPSPSSLYRRRTMESTDASWRIKSAVRTRNSPWWSTVSGVRKRGFLCWSLGGGTVSWPHVLYVSECVFWSRRWTCLLWPVQSTHSTRTAADSWASAESKVLLFPPQMK